MVRKHDCERNYHIFSVQQHSFQHLRRLQHITSHTRFHLLVSYIREESIRRELTVVYSAGYEQNSAISPAEVTLTVTESDITGDLVAYNGSLIDITFSDYSTWTGAAIWGYDTAHIAVHLDRTSNWTLTADSKLDNFTSSLSTVENVFSNGFNVYYNSSSPVNGWLNNGTIVLNGGGKVTPL